MKYVSLIAQHGVRTFTTNEGRTHFVCRLGMYCVACFRSSFDSTLNHRVSILQLLFYRFYVNQNIIYFITAQSDSRAKK